MGAAAISAVLRPLAGPDVPCRSLPPPAAAAAQWVHPWGAARPVACCLPRRCHWQLHAAAGDSLPGASSSSSSGSSPSSMLSSSLSGAAPPGFLQNPAIAQREALRLFFSATTVEAQQRVLEEAADLVDLGTRCGSVLCGTAASNIVPFTRCRWGPGAGGGEAPKSSQSSPLKPTQDHHPDCKAWRPPCPGPPAAHSLACLLRASALLHMSGTLCHCTSHQDAALHMNQPCHQHCSLTALALSSPLPHPPAACSCCATWRSRHSVACCPARFMSRWAAAATECALSWHVLLARLLVPMHLKMAPHFPLPVDRPRCCTGCTLPSSRRCLSCRRSSWPLRCGRMPRSALLLTGRMRFCSRWAGVCELVFYLNCVRQ